MSRFSSIFVFSVVWGVVGLVDGGSAGKAGATEIIHATYLGGGSYDDVESIVTDGHGFAYITGGTWSNDFPVLGEVVQDTKGAFMDAFVAKIDLATHTLVFATFLGGDGMDEGRGIAVAEDGSIVVVGQTSSMDFPTVGALQEANAGRSGGISGGSDGDVFVVRLSADGREIMFSTFLGGSAPEEAFDVALDAEGAIYISGGTASSDFPTVAAFQSVFGGQPDPVGVVEAAGDGFVAKLSADGSALLFSSYLGGSGQDSVGALAWGSDGNLVVAGTTESADFPTRGANVDSLSGSSDIFIAGISANGGELLFGTYLGGSGAEEARDIAVDSTGAILVAGSTTSADYPALEAFQPALGGLMDAVVTKMPAEGGGIQWSTFLGGKDYDEATGIALDSNDRVYVVGYTLSPDFPTQDAVQEQYAGGRDAFLTAYSSDGKTLLRGTCVGGSSVENAYGVALDDLGNVCVVGSTSSPDFPTRNPTYPEFMEARDGFVVQMNPIAVAGELLLSSVVPSAGADNGTVTIRIRGTGFAEGATVGLAREGQESVTLAESVSLDESGQMLSATFVMESEPLGERDIVVTNPDGTSGTLTDGFQIEARAPMSLEVEILGRNRYRTGRATRAMFLVHNRSNVDATGVPAWIMTSATTSQWEAEFPVQALLTPEGEAIDLDFGAGETWYDVDSGRLFPTFLSSIPAGGTVTLTMAVTYASDDESELVFRVNPPMYQSPINQEALGCIIGIFTVAFNALDLVIPAACYGSPRVTEILSKNLVLTGSGAAASGGMSISSSIQLFMALIAHVAECAGHHLPAEKLWGAAVTALSLVDTIEVCLDDEDQGCVIPALCGDVGEESTTPAGPQAGPISPPSSNPSSPNYCYNGWGPGCQHPEARRKQEGGSSSDPNEKVGPGGAGEGHVVQANRTLSYQVFFENKAEATAAAQEVTITDVLDLTAVDIETLEFGPITFGGTTVVPLDGSGLLDETVDLRPAMNLLVHITTQVNRTTGKVEWTLRSVDALTGEFPEDPEAGFLPPNVTSPEGEGSVSYWIEPRSDVHAGQVVRNSASIVFDLNAPIITNEWVNTLDSTAPTSAVAVLPETTAARSFTVTWDGSDEGSAVAHYDVFVSDNGAGFSPWLVGTSLVSAEFQGKVDHHYRFFTQAVDLAGNVEALPEAADAETTVVEPESSSGGGCQAGDSRPGWLFGILWFALFTLWLRKRTTLAQRQDAETPRSS